MCCTSIRSKPPPAPAEELADGGDEETNKLQDDMPVYDYLNNSLSKVYATTLIDTYTQFAEVAEVENNKLVTIVSTSSVCGTILISVGIIIIVAILSLCSKSKSEAAQNQQQTEEDRVLCDPDGSLELDEDIFRAEQGCERLVPTMKKYEAMATGTDCRPVWMMSRELLLI